MTTHVVKKTAVSAVQVTAAANRGTTMTARKTERRKQTQIPAVRLWVLAAL